MRSQPVATAVLRAAVDLHLVGYSSPVPSRLLFELHGRYPGGRDDWASFEAALQWLRTPVFGAASLFVHIPGVGDRVFDYVRHRIAGVPVEDAWTAACRHATPRVLHSLALAHGDPIAAHGLALCT